MLGNYFMGQEFVCILAHKAQKKQTENAVQGASALRDRENHIISQKKLHQMKNLKLNELSKQQMRQLIGGEDRKIVRSENVLHIII